MKSIHLTLLTLVLLIPASGLYAQSDVTASISASDKTAEMSNGIVSLTINSRGQVSSLDYNGNNLLEGGGRFYFSYNESAYHELDPDLVKMGQNTADIAEVIYVNNTGLLTIEQGYILRKGVSGVYTYVNVKSERETVNVRELRVVHRVSPSLFDYAYTSDKVQGPMVSVSELQNSTEVMDATYQLQDGSIYTKYDWANYVKDDLFHGMVATSINTGVWVVSASDEYLNGGPMKQELMVHGTSKTPLALKMLQGEHFGASSQRFAPGEGKMYGPYFVYINQSDSKEGAIADAKKVAKAEVNTWPYQWMDHPEFQTERAEVSGKIEMINKEPTKNLMVVLAKSGEKIYDQGKEYMFWSEVDASGNFSIPNVRSGSYSLYAFAQGGDITEKFEHKNVLIAEGQDKDLGTLQWETSRLPQTLWVLGVSDRKSEEFKLGSGRRRFGIWEDVPSSLDYTIGTNNPAEDWYYAQTKRGSWNIIFDITDSLDFQGNARLSIGIAGATDSEVEVSVNSNKIRDMSFSNDGSVYRSANTGGRYDMRTLSFPESSLKMGENVVTLKLTDVGSRGGVMYDVIKLEIPTGNTEPIDVLANAENPTFQVYPNPVSSHVTIQLSQENKHGTSLMVMGLSGNTLRTEQIQAGKAQANLDLTELPPGIYLLKLSGEAFTYTERILIIK